MCIKIEFARDILLFSFTAHRWCVSAAWRTRSRSVLNLVLPGLRVATSTASGPSETQRVERVVLMFQVDQQRTSTTLGVRNKCFREDCLLLCRSTTPRACSRTDSESSTSSGSKIGWSNARVDTMLSSKETPRQVSTLNRLHANDGWGGERFVGAWERRGKSTLCPV